MKKGRAYGFCEKCGEWRKLGEHHSNGYLPPHEDFTVRYCKPCDKLDHELHPEKYRDTTPIERHAASSLSWKRRNRKCRTIMSDAIFGIFKIQWHFYYYPLSDEIRIDDTCRRLIKKNVYKGPVKTSKLPKELQELKKEDRDKQLMIREPKSDFVYLDVPEGLFE
jgi:hypothetical protein